MITTGPGQNECPTKRHCVSLHPAFGAIHNDVAQIQLRLRKRLVRLRPLPLGEHREEFKLRQYHCGIVN
jgi:hypothetical protein